MIDKFGPSKAGALLGSFDTLMMLGLAFGNGTRIYPIYIAAFGVAMMAETPAVQPALTISVFGAKEYQSANRFLSIVINLISACALLYMSIIHDMTGSYTMAYLIMAVICAICTVLMLATRRSYK